MHIAQILKLMILPIYLPSVFMAVGSGAALLIIPLAALEFSDNVGIAGAVFSLKGVGMLATGIPGAMLLARKGTKIAMLIATTLVCIAAIFASQTNSNYGMGITSLLLGMGAGLWLLARVHYISENVQIESRGRAMAVLAGIERLGWIIGPLVSGYLIKFYSFQIAFLCVALLAIIALIMVLAFGKNHLAENSIETRPGLAAIFDVVKTYRGIFLSAGLVSISLQLMRSGRSFIIPVWGKQLGLDELSIASIIFWATLADLSMFYPTGIILDKLGRKAAGIPCLLLFSCAYFLLPLSSSYTGFLLVALIAGLGNGFGTGLIMTLGADYAPVQRRAAFLGSWRTVGDIGHLSGPILIGAIATSLSLASASIVTGLIGLIGSAIFLSRVQETLKR